MTAQVAVTTARDEREEIAPVGAPSASWTSAAADTPAAASARPRTAPGPVCHPTQSGANDASPATTASGPAGHAGRRDHVNNPAAISAQPAASSTTAAAVERPA